ncbi:hypothetical protein [Nostoc sphaeroides]|uniref:Uncharacterized protein n=1 Tax=Nostoc sphaeroides CCNUC1 TaxID=2653204 RepID=A0A5P8WBR2_9NOSO|nr:hypothetical protein [Nostoc sphaeroides]MCC5632113.1 hypothetical protein [Nostoc sphaeroides CHAB 2801]QFS50032.1 hypothetical protein GXM_07526 [Nostoc sphaeroides CCNUC1]
MWQDEILDEIHQIREEHAKSFNYDLEAMFADWQKKQAESGREVVNLSVKRCLTTHWSGHKKDPGEDAQHGKATI